MPIHHTDPLALTMAVVLGALIADLPPQNLPVFGGSGGTAYARDCGAGRVMTGIRGRGGLSLDAIGLLCRPVDAQGALGPESTMASLVGGSGGTAEARSCPVGQVMTGIRISYGGFVDRVQPQCRPWKAATRSVDGATDGTATIGRKTFTSEREVLSLCESSKQPASGIRGRAGTLVDALGLVCDEP